MIDAHQHLWLIGHNDCEWPTPDLAAIHRDYAVADLEAVARPLGITGSVLVQSQPSDRDTDWMLEAANDAPFILGVIGWADIKAADAPKRIAHLARLEPSAHESERLLVQINEFFGIVEKMRAVDTTGVEPLTHPVEVVQAVALRLREDQATEPNRREANQRSAPAVENGLFLVPKVIE